MLRTIIGFCLRQRLVVLVLAGILVVGGIVAVGHAPWDVFPEFAQPQIVVQTEAPGLSAEEVERLVTVPVESVLSGVTRLQTLRSSSISGLSVVTAVFEEGTNVLAARQLVGERLAEIALPEGVARPRMAPLAASTSRLLIVGLTSSKTSPRDLRTLADWRFARRLQAVPGVARVEVFGIAVRNGILLVSHYQHLREHEGLPPDRQLIVRGACERLAPILMTALTTALSLLPLVVLGGRPGYEIEHPMAVVIVGGLVSSTLLTLGLLPVLYDRMGGGTARG